MAKPILATDFKDDIMQEAMNGKRRYRMVNNTDGTVSFEDVTEYEQVGNSYGAGQINATNEAVNQSVDANKVVKELSTISAITQEGYVPDALAVKELNSSLGGCTLEQEGGDFFIVGADSVRKKLGNGTIEFTLQYAKYDISFDVSEYSLFELTITTNHVYSKLDIYLDGTSIYSVGFNTSKNETKSFDISGKSTLRFKGDFHHVGTEGYADIKGRILDVKIS